MKGFSLLEVLVAFSVLTLFLGVLLGLFSTGLRNSLAAHDYSQAISLAESKLAEVGVTERLAPGEWQGAFDEHYRWRLRVVPFAGGERRWADLPLQPFEVTVEVSWQTGQRDRSVALSTLRLARRQ